MKLLLFFFFIAALGGFFASSIIFSRRHKIEAGEITNPVSNYQLGWIIALTGCSVLIFFNLLTLSFIY